MTWRAISARPYPALHDGGELRLVHVHQLRDGGLKRLERPHFVRRAQLHGAVHQGRVNTVSKQLGSEWPGQGADCGECAQVH